MRTLYLILSIVFGVAILILAFSNWFQYNYVFFGIPASMPSTLPFIIIGIFGIIVGTSLTLYIKASGSDDDDSDNEDF